MKKEKKVIIADTASAIGYLKPLFENRKEECN
jgi:hypothetical protein